MINIKPPKIKDAVGEELSPSTTSVRQAINILSKKLGFESSPTVSNITLTNLTASALVGTNADKLMESVTIGNSLSYVRPTLDTIQDIRVSASPQFLGYIIKDSSDTIVMYADTDDFYITEYAVPENGNPIGLLLVWTYAGL